MPAHPQIDLLIPLAKHKLAGLDVWRLLLCTMLQLIWLTGRELGVQHPAHTTQVPQVGGKAAVCKLHSAHTQMFVLRGINSWDKCRDPGPEPVFHCRQ